MLAAAVRRGLETPLLIGDMPFGSYEASNELAIASAQRFVKEAGSTRSSSNAAAPPSTAPARSSAPGSR